MSATMEYPELLRDFSMISFLGAAAEECFYFIPDFSRKGFISSNQDAGRIRVMFCLRKDIGSNNAGIGSVSRQ